VKTRGAIIRQAPGKYEVVDLDLDDPRQGEVRVKMVASGMCHSDDHIATGDILREAIRLRTSAGRKAKPFVRKGKLVPDDLVNQLVANRFRRDDPEARFDLVAHTRDTVVYTPEGARVLSAIPCDLIVVG